MNFEESTHKSSWLFSPAKLVGRGANVTPCMAMVTKRLHGGARRHIRLMIWFLSTGTNTQHKSAAGSQQQLPSGAPRAFSITPPAVGPC